MPQFKMVKYHTQAYPVSIPLNVNEVAGHFDISDIKCSTPYSLHTEYSYGKRTFSNAFVKRYPVLLNSNKNGVPELWKNVEWAEAFAHYIIDNIQRLPSPNVIEIHPPFNNYVTTVKEFIHIYRAFENIIMPVCPNTEIHIENRCGSIYNGGKFLISKADSLIELSQHIEKDNLNLRIALDIPQIYTSHNVTTKTNYDVMALLKQLEKVRKYIGGVHLWGKKTINGRRIAHHGTLDTYFYNDNDLKNCFLDSLNELFDDNMVRNLVLEVNSNNIDLLSIISDLNKANFKYV